MIKIFGLLQSRALRPLWALEEAEASYEFHRINMSEGEHRSEWFKKLNPCGKIPVMTDGDLTLFESAAICEYVAQKFPQNRLIPETGTDEYALYRQWMYYTVTELEQPLWLLAKHTFVLPTEYRLPDVSKVAQYEFEKATGVLAGSLATRNFLSGNSFSLADIMAGQTILWALKYEVPVNFPVLHDYASRLKERPAFKRVMDKCR